MPRPRDPSIDRRVVDACVLLLGEVGREGLTRARIAARAGVSLPAVNRRFASVDDVLLEVARTPGRSPATGDPAATSLREFLVSWLTAMSGSFTAGPVRRPAAELLAAAAGNAVLDATFRQTLREVRAEGLAWVEHARTRGEVAPDVDAEAILDLAAGAAYYRLLWRDEAITPADAETIVGLVLDGAVPREPRPADPEG